jgi:hypothetical protein
MLYELMLVNADLEHQSTDCRRIKGKVGGFLRVTKAVDKRLLSTLKILGVVELLRIPLNLIHELRDSNGVRARTGIAGEYVFAWGVSDVASVIRAIEGLPVPA